MIRALLSQKAPTRTVLPSPRCPLRLRIRLASGKKRIVKFTGAKCTIGSHPDSTLRIPSPSSSSVFCLLLRTHGKLVVRSWAEECRLNGLQFDIASLRTGDTLKVPGASIRIQRATVTKSNRKKTKSRASDLGKSLVREVGSRLVHLENRLIKQQIRLTKQLEMQSRKPSAAIPTPIDAEAKNNKPIESPPSPMLVEGINTLKSAVEELRSQVEQVANRTWPVVQPAPAVDHEAFISAASARMGEIIQTNLREERVQSSLKFEQIGREFDRIGERLGEVEQKLNLPKTDDFADKLRPVCDAVDFIRTGMQSIEARQTLDAQQLATLTQGLSSFSQLNIDRLTELSDKFAELPNVQKLESSLLTVSDKVDEISNEFAKHRELFVTREEIASLVKNMESANAVQPALENRFLAIDERFDNILGQWTQLQSGLDVQFRSIAERIDALPHSNTASPSEPIDLSPLENRLGETRLELADHARVLMTLGETQQTLTERVENATQLIEQLQSLATTQQSHSERIEQLAAETASVRSHNEESFEQTRTAQNGLIEKLLALEDRCVNLENELARRSHAAPQAPFAPPQNEYSPSQLVQSNEVDSSTATQSGFAGNLASQTPQEESTHSDLSDSAQFAAFRGGTLPSRPSTVEATRDHVASPDAGPTESAGDNANVPNSILDSLRRSGIWKDDSAPSASDSDAFSLKTQSLQTQSHLSATADMESPDTDASSDDVESIYQAETTPPDAVEPAAHPADASSKTPWASPHPVAADHDEESIDAYMERLLQRVSNGSMEVTGAMAVAEQLQRAKAQASKKNKARATETEAGDFEYAPKVAAPEKNADLTALRELAMTSANANIQNYHAATKAKTANEKWIVVVVAMCSAIGLCYMCLQHKSDWAYLAAGASFMVALFWAIQATFSTSVAKKIGAAAKAPVEKTDAKINVSLLQKTKKPKTPPDQVSAGVTFQALVAERERANAEAQNPDSNEASPIEL